MCASQCVCLRTHVCSRMAQGPVCDVNTGRVNTQAACSLHCYYPVCIISLINCSHQRRCPLKYFYASVHVKENRVGRGSSDSHPCLPLRHAQLLLYEAPEVSVGKCATKVSGGNFLSLSVMLEYKSYKLRARQGSSSLIYSLAFAWLAVLVVKEVCSILLGRWFGESCRKSFDVGKACEEVVTLSTQVQASRSL